MVRKMILCNTNRGINNKVDFEKRQRQYMVLGLLPLSPRYCNTMDLLTFDSLFLFDYILLPLLVLSIILLNVVILAL